MKTPFWLLVGAAAAGAAYAEPLKQTAANEARRLFDPATLRDVFGEDAENIDFARLMDAGELGWRQFDLFVNGRFVIEQNVELVRRPDGTVGARIPAMPVLLQPLRMNELPALARYRAADYIDDLSSLIPGAEVKLQATQGRVDIEIPRGWYRDFGVQSDIAPVQRWTYGIPAAIVNYSANADYTLWNDYSAKHAYLSLSGRLHWNEWRLVADGSFTADEDELGTQTEFERGSAYVTRDFGDARARMKAGEIFTQSFYLDSVPLVGIEIYDDESMLSTSESSYVPMVVGIAASPARVTVRQFGRIVFERNVEAGPFEFANLPGLTAGEDLEVTVEEQSGAERVFIVPYNDAPLMLRNGRVHYNVAAGRWRETGDLSRENPYVVTGGVGWGLPWNLTVFGGALLSDDYRDWTGGVAANLGAPGAVSVQVNHADYDIGRIYGSTGEDRRGSRLRLQWSNRIEATQSNIYATYDRYLSGHYRSLSEVLTERESSDVWNAYFDLYAVKDRTALTFSQTLGRWGSWLLSGTYDRYEQGLSRSNVTSTLSTNWRGMTASLSVQHSEYKAETGHDRETIALFSLTIPLSLIAGYDYGTHYANFNLQRRDDGRFEAYEGVSGSFGKAHDWSYALTASQQNPGAAYSGTLSNDGRFGSFSLTASRDEDSKRIAFSGNGSLVGTRYGLFPARSIMGASVLIEVPHAPEATPRNYSVSSRINDRLLVTGLNNYRVNDVVIDPNTVPANVMMPLYLRRMVPADDAVLAVSFETMLGWQFVPELHLPDGTPLPFGASTRIIAHGAISGMDTVLNQNARAYFPAAPITGVVEARWEEEGEALRCWAPYSLKKSLTESSDGRTIVRQSLSCHIWPQKERAATGTQP